MSIQSRRRRGAKFTLGPASVAAAFPGTRNTIDNPMLAAHTSVWRTEMAARKDRSRDILDEVFAVTKRAGSARCSSSRSS
jgi:hypothetical protein